MEPGGDERGVSLDPASLRRNPIGSSLSRRDAVFSVRSVNLLDAVQVDPDDLPPVPLACPVGQLGAFATLVPLTGPMDSFSLSGSAADPICYTHPDGSWTDVDGVVVLRGQVRRHVQLPDKGWTRGLILKDAFEGDWRLHVIEFCNLKPRCSTGPSAWMVERLYAAAQATVLPALFVFVGAWLVELGIRIGSENLLAGGA
jgi:hypothetical protein